MTKGGSAIRIRVQKLGALEEADIRLKPLTVFVGPNNTGKTYSAYLIASLFGRYGWSQYISAYIDGRTSRKYEPVDTAINQLIEEGSASIDISTFIKDHSADYYDDLAELCPGWMKDYFGTTRVALDDLAVEVNIEEYVERLVESSLNAAFRGRLGAGKERKSLVSFVKEGGESRVFIYTEDEDAQDKIPIKEIRRFVSSNIFMLVHRALFRDIWVFGAERTGIPLLYCSVRSRRAMDEETRFDDSHEPESEKPRFPYPVGDLASTILDIRRWGDLNRRHQDAERVPGIKKYLEYADLLEREILEGHLVLSTDDPDPFREILFEWGTDRKIPMDMSVTASMVKGLSPLVLYLRYTVSPGELIIIDEPEMNLHPKAQAQLMELLAMLVNCGLNVLITTHSPYFVDHLVNLMEASRRKDPEAIKDLFFLRDPDAFISQEKVSVYLFEGGRTRDILEEDGFIEWETFSSVSERVSRIYFDMDEVEDVV
ncbi:MAG: AAA family ATPase [Methanomicrobiales archaeon]|nr:AAA family ATPase [Methanomicrobiales archaeon]